MTASPAKCLSQFQWDVIEFAFNRAIATGIYFESLDQAEHHLKEAGQDVDSLGPHWKEIFDLYLKVKAKAPSPPSPPLSAEPYPNTVETAQEAEDCPERNDTIAPIFTPDVSQWN
jgi:hypothetical protein